MPLNPSNLFLLSSQLSEFLLALPMDPPSGGDPTTFESFCRCVWVGRGEGRGRENRPVPICKGRDSCCLELARDNKPGAPTPFITRSTAAIQSPTKLTQLPRRVGTGLNTEERATLRDRLRDVGLLEHVVGDVTSALLVGSWELGSVTGAGGCWSTWWVCCKLALFERRSGLKWP